MENGQRLLTSEDLCFVDYDIDTRPEDIKYSHHALPNGELVQASNPTEAVFEFTQADLNERRILFKHIGAAFGRIMLWVSDGQYYASTELKVSQACNFVFCYKYFIRYFLQLRSEQVHRLLKSSIIVDS